jgi:hypothetical protein
MEDAQEKKVAWASCPCFPAQRTDAGEASFALPRRLWRKPLRESTFDRLPPHNALRGQDAHATFLLHR